MLIYNIIHSITYHRKRTEDIQVLATRNSFVVVALGTVIAFTADAKMCLPRFTYVRARRKNASIAYNRLEELVDRAKVSCSTYLLGLKICSKGNSFVIQRKPSECWINTYNPDVISVESYHGSSVHLGSIRMRNVHCFLHAQI